MSLRSRITDILFGIDEHLNHRFFRWVTRKRIDQAVASKRFCDWVDRRLWLEFHDDLEDYPKYPGYPE